MCGIGGVWCFEGVKLNKEDAEKIKTLSILLEERGTDAYGFYNGDKVVKFPSRASQVIKMIENIKPFYKLVKGRTMFLIHTRLATIGDPINNENNHPFETKDFVLAHNGSIYRNVKFVTKSQFNYYVKNSKRTRDKYDIEVIEPKEIFGNDKYEIPETDSFEIVVRIQEEYNEINDPMEAFKNAMNKLYHKGVYAIWCYSKRDNILMLYKDSNPLFYSIEDNKLWFASEDWMLQAIGLHDVKSLRAGVIRVFSKSGFEEDLIVYEYDDDYKFSCESYCLEYDICKELYAMDRVRLCDYDEKSKYDKRHWKKYWWYYY